MLKEYLKSYRVKHNLTQSDMAKLLKTTQGNYSRLETGHRKPGFAMIRKLAEVLNQTPEFVRSLL